MEYGVQIGTADYRKNDYNTVSNAASYKKNLKAKDISVRNDDFMRYTGYKENSDIHKFFDPRNVTLISKKVTELLMGVHPENRPILVPDQTILNIMDSVNLYFRPQTGDIYSRYNIFDGQNCPSYIQQMVDQVIEIIVSDVRNNLGTDENNRKLTIWTTVLGDFNPAGLIGHSIIKTRERHPNYMEFNMNY